jgi:hypothetical protein
MTTFTEFVTVGKLGESAIATWLRIACRYHVLPVYEIQMETGKGPVFYEQGGTVRIAPDLLAFRSEGANRAQIRWIEAKTKSAFSWHRLSNQWVTGVDLRHYDDYLKVAEASPWPVWLLFLHLDGVAKDTPPGMAGPTGLFGAELLRLKSREHHRHKNWGKSGMVYWTADTLTRLATLDQVSAALARARETNPILPPSESGGEQVNSAQSGASIPSDPPERVG